MRVRGYDRDISIVWIDADGSGHVWFWDDDMVLEEGTRDVSSTISAIR